MASSLKERLDNGRAVVDEVRASPLGRIFGNQTLGIGAFLVLFVPLLILGPLLVEVNNAGWFVVKQSAFTGKMEAITQAGPFAQMFGKVTYYRAAEELHFGAGSRTPIEARFNDGAKASIVVNVRYALPSDETALLNIHQTFRSDEALKRQTIEQVISEAVILTAALMSAEESYTTKRAEFSHLAEDQVKNGVYLTEAEVVTTKDAKTGETVTRSVVSIQLDKQGRPERKEPVLPQYGIKLSQFVIRDVDYSDEVDKMIEAKQTALQQTVSAKAQAEKAAQDRITAEEVGKKDVAIARYEKEVEKIKFITDAQKALEVARLDRQTAEQYRAKKLLEADGDAEYKRRMMAADGALTQKLEAWTKAQEFWANAVANAKLSLVPSVVLGGTGGASGNHNAAMTMMELISIKAAKDLAVEVAPRK